jgi:hypothetical protein
MRLPRFPTRQRHPHMLAMGTKRFEDLYDCWRHVTGASVEYLNCGQHKCYRMPTWPKKVPCNRTYRQAARYFRCGECGSKQIVVYPGAVPRWKGNR